MNKFRPNRSGLQGRFSKSRRQNPRLRNRGLRALTRSSAPAVWRKFCDYFFSSGGACHETRSFRCSLLLMVLALGASAVLARVCYVQAGQQGKWDRLASRQHETSIQINGARGTIYDSAGRELALSLETLIVGIHPSRLEADRREVAAKIAGLLGEPIGEIAYKLSLPKRYVRLAAGVPKEKFAELQNLGLSALQIDSEFRRQYPLGELAREILGQVSRDGKGQSGIELRYESTLSAPNQKLAVSRDARGRLFPFQDSSSTDLFPVGLFDPSKRTFIVQPQSDPMLRAEGDPIQLTIDSTVQQVLEDEFDIGREKAQAKAVFGMVMDADTGEILALAQAPSGFRKKTKDGKPEKEDNLTDLMSGDGFFRPDQLKNLNIQETFEPGSTFKPLVAAAGMDKGKVHSEELMNCENGRYQVGKHFIRDVHPVGTVPLSEVLVRRSNVGITKVGQRLGKEELSRAILALGFGSATGVELPGEERGIVRKLSNWKPIDTATASFGQGLSVTAIQMVRAYATLANGGKLVQPTLVKRGNRGEPVTVFSSKVADRVGEILVGVTSSQHGTGKNAALQGIAVSGKTGTAQKARTGGRGYDSERVFSSFIGFVNGAPVGVNRKLVMFVGVDEPGVRPRWGGTVAAPVFRRAMERILSHYLMHRNGTELPPIVSSASDVVS